jgi:hypothetical protein
MHGIIRDDARAARAEASLNAMPTPLAGEAFAMLSGRGAP